MNFRVPPSYVLKAVIRSVEGKKTCGEKRDEGLVWRWARWKKNDDKLGTRWNELRKQMKNDG